MKKIFFVLGLVFCLTIFANIAQAQEVEITDFVFCSSLEGYTPVATAEVFSKSVGRVYFWTHIKAKNVPAIIEHVWFFKDKEMARIPLVVKYPNYRCYSYKTIIEKWVGDWRVDVVDASGRVLKSAPFVIE
ncbi:MAG: DUF2914 domain-containing protein [Candidatus Saganbacteria bacterium]|nr:DUF2914 domain-containing protein [Candidatus Saganbacteria bacterium]